MRYSQIILSLKKYFFKEESRQSEIYLFKFKQITTTEKYQVSDNAINTLKSEVQFFSVLAEALVIPSTNLINFS